MVGGVVRIYANKEICVRIAQLRDVVVDHPLDDFVFVPEGHEDGHPARRGVVEFLFRGSLFISYGAEKARDIDDQVIDPVEKDPEGEGREQPRDPMVERHPVREQCQSGTEILRNPFCYHEVRQVSGSVQWAAANPARSGRKQR